LAVISLVAGWGIIGIWLAIYAFIAARALVTGLRLHHDAWTGAAVRT
jgi:Na+-driven multidrug efflux pump